MFLKPVLLSCFLILNTTSSFSQTATKAKRKGLMPVIVTRLNPGGRLSYSMDQLHGKWQEILRTDRKSDTAMSFKDSLCLTFAGNNVITRDGVNMSLRGSASLQRGDYLVAAADVYTIKALNNNMAILDDGDRCIHTLIRKKDFWFETLSGIPAVFEKYDTAVSINLSDLPGKWYVYRRDAKPGYLASTDYLIQMVNVTFTKDEHNAMGEISYYLGDKLERMPCNIVIEGNEINITSEKYTWLMNTYKANGTEFIFGDSQLLYYSKPV